MLIFRVLLSVVLGILLGLSNLYIALKVGVTVGVAILAVFCWAGLDGLFSRFRHWPPLDTAEYACFQSLASAMSYGCGTVIATSLAALVMAGEIHSPTWVLALWVSAVCGLGTCLALPLRERMLTRLPFPSGAVAAETVQKIGVRKEPRLFFACLAAAWAWMSAMRFIPQLAVHLRAWGHSWFHPSPMMIGLGALLGVRTCSAMALGGLLFFVILPGRMGSDAGDGESTILWFAISMALSASLADLVSMCRGLRVGGAGEVKRSFRIPHPKTLIALSLSVLLISIWGLDMPPLLAIGSVLLAPLFAVIACRITGETDVVPTGPLGKLSLVVFSFLQPAGVAGGLAATATLTGSSASSADFMTDLQCGRKLDCPVKRQYGYQLFGAMLGPLIFVPLFMILVSAGMQPGGGMFPAPAAQLWLRVAELAALGHITQGPYAQAIMWGLVVGVAGWLLQNSPVIGRWCPPVIPLAVAALLSLETVCTMLAGALIAHFVPKDKGLKIWCAMLAAESTFAVVMLLIG